MYLVPMYCDPSFSLVENSKSVAKSNLTVTQSAARLTPQYILYTATSHAVVSSVRSEATAVAARVAS